MVLGLRPPTRGGAPGENGARWAVPPTRCHVGPRPAGPGVLRTSGVPEYLSKALRPSYDAQRRTTLVAPVPAHRSRHYQRWLV